LAAKGGQAGNANAPGLELSRKLPSSWQFKAFNAGLPATQRRNTIKAPLLTAFRCAVLIYDPSKQRVAMLLLSKKK
jgi:hypothetical protein